MTVASEIAQLIETMMKSAIIVSPRFTDYRVYTIPDYGRQGDLERAIDEALQEKREGGEAESELALDLYEAESPYATYPFSEDEFGQMREAHGKKTKFGEQEATSLVRSGISGAQNPLSSLEALMGRLPHSALILLAVSLAPLIIEELKKPGSLLDVRFKRIMADEFNAFLDRQDQWNTQLGLRQVIVQSQAGFLMQSGAAMSENNLRQVRESEQRLALIDFTDHAKELF